MLAPTDTVPPAGRMIGSAMASRGNNYRYDRQDYVRIGEVETVLDGAVVTTMWRPV